MNNHFIQISVYDHQIVLWNPGCLPANWTLERLLDKHPSAPFNPLLANTFFRSGYIESWGRGIEKIQQACQQHKIPKPVFDFGMAGLMLTFRANSQQLKALQDGAGQSTQETTGKTTGKTPDLILALVLKDAQLSIPAMATQMGKSERAIERAIKKLRDEGKLVRIGPAKGGHWQVLEDNK